MGDRGPAKLLCYKPEMYKLACCCMLTVAALGSCYRLPQWRGNVDVTPVDREGIEACGAGELTQAGGRHLQRGPYLQSVTSQRATVAFAAWPDPAYRVEVTTPDGERVASAAARFAGDPAQAESSVRRGQPEISQQAIEPAHFYIQRADLGGLQPGTLYCYRLLGPGGPHTAAAPLTTAPSPGSGEPIDLVVVGDTGTGNAAARAIARRLEEVPFELLLFLGDIAYTHGTAAELDANFFGVFQRYLRVVPAFTAMGNHEYRTDDARFYLRDLVLPGRERYYSFDWGDVHVVVLDTNRLDDEQLAWLEQDLAGRTRRWVIVGGHHPPYSSSWRGDNRPAQRLLVPIFEHYGVDLVLSGHEHHYERLLPQANVHYVVTGGGGGRLTRVGSGPRTLVRAAVHHYLAIRVDGERLTGRAIDIEGKLIDHFTIQKDS